MTLKTLKDWIKEIPDDYNKYSVIFRSYKNIEGTDLEVMLDQPIVAGFLDEDHEEFCLLDDESYKELKRLEDDSNI